ncbi:kinesin-like protein Klp61F isoform X1 [Phlebotomus papatasi]|uniref:kinesin-like protein Klp61F isoform X1 n=1 Tax=Phlebotomus papatasi TaxID=29031 RepID=UPI002484035F|nr:kinesin-like protein Klp61F isoform X1 [Phlebotomus papatasi]
MDTSGPSTNTKSRGNQNIQVYLRVRPLSVREHHQRSVEVVEVPTNRDIQVRQTHDAKIAKKFTFDRVFGDKSKQKDVYHTVVAPFIGEVLSGYNCTVFAYGQTGTGKTYTMVGDEAPLLKASWEDDSPLGIIPRAVVHLFDELRMMDVEFSMRISYLELYNEELCDLLATEDNKIRIYDDTTKKGSVIVHGLEEIPVHSKDDVYKLLAKGQERRKTATTLMNAQSSRSHTVFSILVHIKENGIDGEEMLKTGKLNLVDLAGSENITKAGNEKGIRTRETVNINQSLLTLGRVITALVERQPHVPYRESKLTRLLQESLGGRTKTSIIATISPGHKDLEETLNTLDYAHRAKNIQNRPEINQRLTKKTVLKDYTEEIDRLKRELNAAREKTGVFLPKDDYESMMQNFDSHIKELNEKMLMIRALKDELEKKEAVFLELQKHVVQTTLQLKRTEQKYEETTHLVKAHEATEKKLTGQARSLIEVADEASGDTYGLHEALKRRKIVDGTINKTVENFVEELNGKIGQVHSKVINFRQNIDIQSFEIGQELEKNSNRQKVSANEMRTQLLAMENLNRTSSMESVEIFDNFRQCLGQMSDKNCEKLTEMLQEIELRQKNYHEEMQAHVDQVKSLEARRKENFENLLGNMEIFQKNTHDNVEHYMEFSMDFLKQLREHLEVILVERNEEMRQRIMENEETFENISKEMMAAREKNKSLLALLNNNSKDKEIIDDKSNKLQMQATEFRENAINSRATMDKDRQNFEEKSVEIAKDHKDMMEKFSEKNDGNFEFLIEEMANLTEVLGTQRDNLKAEADELGRKIHENHKNSTENFHLKIQTAIEDVDKEESATIDTQNSVNVIIGQTKDSADDFKDFICNVVQRMESDINNLYMNDLKTYTSTGETPVRREFKYSRELAATSPHERILNRFRTTLNRISSGSQASGENLQSNQEELDVLPERPQVSSTPLHNNVETRCLRELNSNTVITSTLARKDDLRNTSVIEISSDEVGLQ